MLIQVTDETRRLLFTYHKDQEAPGTFRVIMFDDNPNLFTVEYKNGRLETRTGSGTWMIIDREKWERLKAVVDEALTSDVQE